MASKRKREQLDDEDELSRPSHRRNVGEPVMGMAPNLGTGAIAVPVASVGTDGRPRYPVTTLPDLSEEDEWWLKNYPPTLYRHLADASTQRSDRAASSISVRRYPEPRREQEELEIYGQTLMRDVGTDMPRVWARPKGSTGEYKSYIEPRPSTEAIRTFLPSPYATDLGIDDEPFFVSQEDIQPRRSAFKPKKPSTLGERLASALREQAAAAASSAGSSAFGFLRAAYQRPSALPGLLVPQLRSLPKEGKGRRKSKHVRY